jgi:hypothetical protein
MEMNKEQLYAAQTAMIEWLSDPHELGKKPFKIECAGEFDFNEMHYYIFKFKASLLGKWLVGVCGGFEDDDLKIALKMGNHLHNKCKRILFKLIEENIEKWWD